jgi:hypothetical protein
MAIGVAVHMAGSAPVASFAKALAFCGIGLRNNTLANA